MMKRIALSLIYLSKLYTLGYGKESYEFLISHMVILSFNDPLTHYNFFIIFFSNSSSRRKTGESLRASLSAISFQRFRTRSKFYHYLENCSKLI